MVETVEVAALPLAPRNPLSPLQQMKAVRSFHTGCEALRDAGGQVTRCSLAPTWMLPTVVVTTSPKGARDVLSRSYPFVDRAQPVFTEHRRFVGGSLFNFKHQAWLPRRRALQPVFTKQHVTQFAGHMAEGADALSRAWGDGAELDLDQECRRLTLRVLSRSVLGLDLDARADPLESRFAPPRCTSPIAPYGRSVPRGGCRPPPGGAHALPVPPFMDSPTTFSKAAGPTRLATHRLFAR
jgi:cytochrome P450